MAMNKNELCYDIMEMIGKQYTIIKETNKNKKLYGEIVKHLEYYLDDYGWTITPYCVKNGIIRNDTQFLEYEELWFSNHYKIIADKYGGEDEYNDWCDNYF